MVGSCGAHYSQAYREGRYEMGLIPIQVVRRGVMVAGVAAYPVLAHYSTATAVADSAPGFGLAVALMPVLAVLGWLAWQSPRRLLMLVLGAAVAVLLWQSRGVLERNFGWVYFLQHAGIYAALGVAFGLTLRRGRRSLCTRCAEALRGPLSPEVVRYTRQVTAAWALFFLGISLVSTLLFSLGSMGVWSVFANFLSPILIACLFVAEHLVRRRRLPHLERRSIRDSLVAFRHRSKPGPCASAPIR